MSFTIKFLKDVLQIKLYKNLTRETMMVLMQLSDVMQTFTFTPDLGQNTARVNVPPKSLTIFWHWCVLHMRSNAARAPDRRDIMDQPNSNCPVLTVLSAYRCSTPIGLGTAANGAQKARRHAPPTSYPSNMHVCCCSCHCCIHYPYQAKFPDQFHKLTEAIPTNTATGS